MFVRGSDCVPCIHLATYRCFSFGIGSGASTHLVKGIAQAGLGTSEFITSGERMQPKVGACLWQDWAIQRQLTLDTHGISSNV